MKAAILRLYGEPLTTDRDRCARPAVRQAHPGFPDGLQPLPHRHPRCANQCLVGRLELDSLISRRVRLELINDGFAAMTSGELARQVVVR